MKKTKSLLQIIILFSALSLKAQTGPKSFEFKFNSTQLNLIIEKLNKIKSMQSSIDSPEFRVIPDDKIPVPASFRIDIDSEKETVTAEVRLNTDKIQTEKQLLNELLIPVFLNKELFYDSFSIPSTLMVTNYSHILFIRELLFNAENGNLTSQLRILDLKIEILSKVRQIQNTELALARDELLQDLTAEKEKLVPREKKQTKENQKKLAQRRQMQNLDDFEGLEKKLNDLVLENDRKSVAKLINAYLPWEIMQPYEVKMWQLWLDAIEFPNRDKSTTVFRGIDFTTDKVQISEDQKSFGFFSTMLTKNQGSYTRRLRSLATSRIKNGNPNTVLSKTKEPAGVDQSNTAVIPLVNTMFMNHAFSPKGSVFLSFSLDPWTALNFSAPYGKGGYLIASIDNRRLIPNLLSGFVSEVEFLTPLIIFPDEVASYNEIKGPKYEFDPFVEIQKLSSFHKERIHNFKQLPALQKEYFGSLTPELYKIMKKNGYSYMSESFKENALYCERLFK